MFHSYCAFYRDFPLQYCASLFEFVRFPLRLPLPRHKYFLEQILLGLGTRPLNPSHQFHHMLYLRRSGGDGGWSGHWTVIFQSLTENVTVPHHTVVSSHATSRQEPSPPTCVGPKGLHLWNENDTFHFVFCLGPNNLILNHPLKGKGAVFYLVHWNSTYIWVKLWMFFCNQYMIVLVPIFFNRERSYEVFFSDDSYLFTN